MNDKTVLTVCDEPLTTLGLREVLVEMAGFKICGEVTGAAEALEMFTRSRPAFVVIAGGRANGEGLGLIKGLHRSHPSPSILIIGSAADSQAVQRAFRAGARGYVTSTNDVKELLLAIKAVEAGGLYVSHHAADGLLMHLNGRTNGGPENDLTALSDREMEIFRLIGHGLGCKEMAGRLGISVKTVDTHRQRMKDKLHLHTGTELNRLALRLMIEETGRKGGH